VAPPPAKRFKSIHRLLLQIVSELRNVTTQRMNSSTACEADSLVFVSSSVHRFELCHVVLAASRAGHWRHVPVSELIENLMLHSTIIEETPYGGACGSPSMMRVFAPQEERCRNVVSFPVQNLNSSDPSYRGHLGEGTEGPRGRGQGG
jgi:hypothetical protein